MAPLDAALLENYIVLRRQTMQQKILSNPGLISIYRSSLRINFLMIGEAFQKAQFFQNNLVTKKSRKF
jgi:hypothetical protein